jgi:hypothetical protein
MCYPKSTQSSNKDSFYVTASALIPKFDMFNVQIEQEFTRQIFILLDNVDHEIDETTQKTLIKNWMDKWDKPISQAFIRFLAGKKNLTIYEFVQNLCMWCEKSRQSRIVCESFLNTVSPNANTSFYGRSKDKLHPSSDKPGGEGPRLKKQREEHKGDTNAPTPTTPKPKCSVCNRPVHGGSVCPYLWHPFANKNYSLAFDQSPKGKEYTATHPRHFKWLDIRDFNGKLYAECPKELAEEVQPLLHAYNPSASSNSKKGSFQGNRSDDVALSSSRYSSYLNSSTTTVKSLADHLVICYISLSQAKVAEASADSRIKIAALLDSGSLAGDFISSDTLLSLGVDTNSFSVDRLRLPICSGVDNVCSSISVVTYSLIVSLVLPNYNLPNFKTSEFSFCAEFRVLPDTPFDIIIGKQTIQTFNLPLVLPHLFFNDDSVKDIQRATYPLLPRSMLLQGSVSGEKDNSGQAPHVAQPCAGCSERLCGCHTGSDLQPALRLTQTGDVRVEAVSGTHTVRTAGEQLDSDEGCYPLPLLAPAQTHGKLITSLVKETQDLFAASIVTDDEIDYEKTDSFAPFLVVEKPLSRNGFFPNDPLLSAILIEGDPELTGPLVTLITKYSHLFRNELSPEPANIPPFDLVVDLEKWRNPKNRGPPRVQSPANQAETVRQIDLLLAQGIIERSNASYYSQV